MVSSVPKILEEVKKYITTVKTKMLINSPFGKNICDQNESAVTRITYNNITPKMFIENYVEETSVKIHLYPHDIYQNMLLKLTERFGI
ncbi:hypothetical protein HZS_8055 [Henneguya salminicola]|nr:hypothetical protein HZS_8055 [Henneguya salminicola]